METRQLGSSGLRVSEIALGSWLTFGTRIDVDGTVELVLRAYDLGVNLFDTADVYANGAAEEALGRALAQIPRHTAVVATKCFFATSEYPNDRGLSRKHIVESVEASLRRLGTDYLDLHQCHRADPDTPMDETLRAYEDLIRQGKILYWGVSQWRAHHVLDACRRADSRNAYRPISNQPAYSIVRREIEAEILPVCSREGVGQIVFSPLAQGALTGKYSGGARPEGSRATDARINRWMGEYLGADTVARVDRLRPLADELGISLAQLALAWCLRSAEVASVIIGATRPEQLDENCKASGVRLSADTVAAIDEIFPPPPNEDAS